MMFREILAGIGASIGGTLLAIAVVVGLSFGTYELYHYFAPKYRAVDNQVYHESPQYNEGMIRDLENLQLEYIKANADQKAALKDIILHRFAVYDQNRLPSNLSSFYNELRSGRL
jgi:hypothetical protein